MIICDRPESDLILSDNSRAVSIALIYVQKGKNLALPQNLSTTTETLLTLSFPAEGTPVKKSILMTSQWYVGPVILYIKPNISQCSCYCSGISRRFLQRNVQTFSILSTRLSLGLSLCFLPLISLLT